VDIVFFPSIVWIWFFFSNAGRYSVFFSRFSSLVDFFPTRYIHKSSMADALCGGWCLDVWWVGRRIPVVKRDNFGTIRLSLAIFGVESLKICALKIVILKSDSFAYHRTIVWIQILA